jgi:phosphinothricin acetyltransferase
MSAAHIRLATPDDAEAIQRIYAPIVLETAISFELVPPTVDEMRRRILKTLEHLPWLVYEHDGAVIGYAYASRHRERAAYQWCADLSAYVHEQWRGRGVGRALYRSLFDLLRAQGYYNVYAGIALPNPGSVALHEALGMRSVGVYEHVGYKFGRWHDVGWWQGQVQAWVAPPAAPRTVGECLNSVPQPGAQVLSEGGEPVIVRRVAEGLTR